MCDTLVLQFAAPLAGSLRGPPRRRGRVLPLSRMPTKNAVAPADGDDATVARRDVIGGVSWSEIAACSALASNSRECVIALILDHHASASRPSPFS